MPYFSHASAEKLNTCHPMLSDLFNSLVKDYDCTILYGYRSPAFQHELYQKGRDYDGYNWYVQNAKDVVTYCDGYKKQSKHNHETSDGEPRSLAVDVLPYINGHVSQNEIDVAYFAGKVMERARQMGIPLKWGNDWDGDNDTQDNRLNDLAHYQLKGIA